MASGKSNFKTPDQPNRVKRDVIDPSPNLNLVYQTLPDLTPPRKNKYSDHFSTIGTAGASPSGTEFGFPRPIDSSPGAFRSGGDGKSDPGFEIFGFRSTPAKGRSPIFDLSSPRSTGLQPPPVPIFQPSPRRASDASTYISPESRRRSSLGTSSVAGGKAFSFSPQPAFASPTATSGAPGSAGGGGAHTTNVNGSHAFTSAFASILGDGHSRISPRNLSAVAAAARDGSAVRAHFGGLFPTDAAAVGGASTGGDVVTGSGAAGVTQPGSNMVPVEGLHNSGNSPLQLHSGRGAPVADAADSDDNDNGEEDDEDAEDDDGYDAVAARRPSRRRALDFSGAGTGVQAGTAAAAGINQDPAAANTTTTILDTANLNSNDGLNTYELPNPLSPSIGPVVIESLDVDTLLPIARLRESSDEEHNALNTRGNGGEKSGSGRPPMLVPSSTRGVSVTTAGGVSLLPGLTRGTGNTGMSLMDFSAQSPISMRPGIIRREDIIDSPAVKEATNAAVAAAMQANAERRPARAAAAGAAAAAAAAAGGTPMSRRPSAANHAAGVGSSLFDASGLLAASNGVPTGGIRCNCKKSRCMKLYCDCFKALGYCGEGCSCVGCSNRGDNAPAVNQARDSILQRNPQAFTEKILSPLESGYGTTKYGTAAPGTATATGILNNNDPSYGPTIGGPQHRRGCNCKKSKCLKKYCECFQAGIACGDSCKCDGCHNTTEMMASGKPPFDKRRPPPPQQQQASVQMQQQQQQQYNNTINTSLQNALLANGDESGGNGLLLKPHSSSIPGSAIGSNTKTVAPLAAGASPANLQAFAALGPAFQQILLQRAFNGSQAAAAANAAAGGAGSATKAIAPGQPGKPGSLTVNNQLLVPITWPTTGANGTSSNNNTTAQQLLQLATSGAIPAFSSQVAAAVVAAQQNAVNVAAAAQAAAQANKINTITTGKSTPSIGPSSQDDPSTVQAGTTTTGTEQQPSDGTDGTGGTHGTAAPRHIALLDGGISQQQQQQGSGAAVAAVEESSGLRSGGSNRRKPALPLSSATGTGTGTSDEDARPRLTPTKRKPARTMTAALM